MLDDNLVASPVQISGYVVLAVDELSMKYEVAQQRSLFTRESN
jgi:hypothetical protein